MLLDFRTAFRGSVFERYHVLPIQVATLEAFSDVDDGNFFWELCEFLQYGENADLLKRDDDAFVNKFSKEIRADLHSPDTSMQRAFVDMTKAFANESPELFEELLEKANAEYFSDFDYDDPICTELEIKLRELALLHSNDYLAKIFHRSGMEVGHESDMDLAIKMFDLCTNAQPLDALERRMRILVTEVHLIDFDAVGVGGKHFPLRMLMLNLTDDGYEDHGWFAEVRDRETDILVARAYESALMEETLGLMEQTRLDIVAADVVEQRYEPHGDVPTLQRTSGYFNDRSWKEPDGYDFQWCDDGFCERAGRQRKVFSKLLPEERKLVVEDLVRLRKNSFSRSHDHSISYSSALEFERLIPVAAMLSSLHFREIFAKRTRPCDHFDSVVRRFELRTSTLDESRKRDLVQNVNGFRGVFKGTCWEQLPDDLITWILSHVVRPQRHLFRPPE
ncbi:hypothetical protein CBR_g38364 [Chara braunii]|uniref:Uncharacterized protein n=1 Tax=Chara braunii TaxID=69332 RepID=A0A388LQ43_CHABU|nr:hypothetical protein CBR_g38364 [Chara braunii]|eukprot:GBG84391.1 hypothetical protein CBR_g38364 [Chara braunii]